MVSSFVFVSFSKKNSLPKTSWHFFAYTFEARVFETRQLQYTTAIQIVLICSVCPKRKTKILDLCLEIPSWSRNWKYSFIRCTEHNTHTHSLTSKEPIPFAPLAILMIWEFIANKSFLSCVTMNKQGTRTKHCSYREKKIGLLISISDRYHHIINR